MDFDGLAPSGSAGTSGGTPGATSGGDDEPRSSTGPVTDRVISMSVNLPIPPVEAFSWFSENERLERWLTAQARVEPVVGGSYELFWNPEDPENDSTIGCRVTALEPGAFIAFQWRSPRQYKPFANAADPLTHVVVMFFADDGGTRVHLLHTGWRSTTEWEAARQWQERAWTIAFAALDRVARARPASQQD